MDSQITELTEQIVAIEEVCKADPDNSELTGLLKELIHAKIALVEASSIQSKAIITPAISKTANPAPAASGAPSRPQVVSTQPRDTLYGTVTIPDGKERVGRVIKDEDGLIRVVFLGINVVKDFTNDQVKYLTSLPSGVFPGAKLEGVYEQDGLWYNCIVVKRLPENRAIIKFDGYKDEVEIRLSWLRPRPAASNARQSTEPAEKEYVTPAGYRIPEKLKIDEKDPEKLKAAKKRKIEELKKEQRHGRQEDEAESRKKSWLDFKKSVGK